MSRHPRDVSHNHLLITATGYLVLEDMHIKRSVLDTLELPMTLGHGIIGRLEITIPWTNLGKDPIVVVIDRVRRN